MRANPRTSIAGLLWVVALAGFWLASIRSVSIVWTSLTATLTLTALLSGVVGAVVNRGRARAFWLGFALFGWAYLLLVNWDWVGGQFGHDLTGGLSDLAEQVIPPVPGAPVPVFGQVRPNRIVTNPNYLDEVQQRSIKVGNFVQIGRMTLSLFFAVVGGLIGRSLAARAEEEAREGPPR